MVTAIEPQVKIKNILFATDFSSASAQAIPYIQNIARHYRASIFALHVRPPAVSLMAPPGTWATQVEAAKAVDEEHRKDLLESFVDFPIAVLIQEGPLESMLQAAIRTNDIDLVVTGTRGRTGVSKMLLGSVAEDILRRVDCPVLIVGPHANSSRTIPGEFTEILCAAELTSVPDQIIEYGVSLAQQFRARIVLAHIVPSLPFDVNEQYDVWTYSRNLLKSQVPSGVEVVSKPEYFVEAGYPAERILGIADETDPDLIIVGAHPQKGFPGAATHFPFAIAHKVIAGAKCPVLSIRSK